MLLQMERELYVRILDAVTVFTLAVQVYVFYLVQYKSPKSMKVGGGVELCGLQPICSMSLIVREFRSIATF